MDKCNFIEENKPCTPDCDCYINHPDDRFMNCWNLFKYFIDREYSGEETAKILGISNVLVSISLGQAIKSMLDKIRENPLVNIEMRNHMKDK